ncbi:MAG: DNA replication and repair protein RecF [Opitutia bacterium UBA7350]|nr:MAG: DNA replication and repair protein RecF [Opitutae bacterium UBA7350]
MRFSTLRLQDFRNIEFGELDLSSERVFLCGSNGQGKSNLLEALGLVTALRSFRTQDLGSMKRQGSAGYRAFYAIEHEVDGRVNLEVEASKGPRSVLVDGEKVGRMSDFIGRFPVVPMSSGDLMLLRGSPGDRRRFMDLTLSALDGAYYLALRNYHKGVAERNRLLKENGSDAELAAFEAELAPHAHRLQRDRSAGVKALHVVLEQVYRSLAEKDEGPVLSYDPNLEANGVESYRDLWERQRSRDRILGATQKGPHRDDFKLGLCLGSAKEYGSDGQQRGLMVALRVAQAVLFQERLSVVPVLLVDDVLGELDPARRAGFWKACPDAFQIIASGTVFPEEAEAWKCYSVTSGSFITA